MFPSIKPKVSATGSRLKQLTAINSIPKRYRQFIRDKAIGRARTRIILAGRKPADFNQDDLEVIVREEEDKIKSAIKQRGLLAVLALLGLNLFG